MFSTLEKLIVSYRGELSIKTCPTTGWPHTEADRGYRSSLMFSLMREMLGEFWQSLNIFIAGERSSSQLNLKLIVYFYIFLSLQM